MRVQDAVARRLRRDLVVTADPMVGEQAAYLELRRELLRRNCREELIDSQLDELQAWTAQLASTFPVDPGALVRPAAEGEYHELEDTEEADDPKDNGDEEDVLPPAPPTPPLKPEEVVEQPPPLPVSDVPQGLPDTGYVVSLSRSDWRRLHRIGGCARHPGVHYLRYELLGDEKPKPEEYDDFCRQCWRTGGPDEASDEEDSESEPEEGDAPLLVDEPGEPGAPGAAEDF